ncbi:MAG: hypothetical protein WD690_04080 [Vicinamibacterales bacterium]
MKRLVTLAAVVSVVALGALVVAQQKPNFSGTWVAVSPAEQAGQEQTITHTESALTLRHGSSGGHHETVYRLDGAPAVNSMPSHGDTIVNKYTASWKGEQLVVDQIAEYPDGRKIDTTLKYSLNAQGQLVTEATFTAAGQEPRKITVVSAKKK